MSEKRILIAAGGTGGHLFPARAAAEALIARGWQVKLVTDARGAVHARGFPASEIIEVEAASPSLKNPIRFVQDTLKLLKGVNQAKALMRAWQPNIVAGFGGYPAFPAMQAAKALAIPYVVHEQNAVLGRVNRVFAGSAYRVASGFERLERLPAGAAHEVLGNPVRAHVLEARQRPYEAPHDDGPIKILILGGSQGARILSTIPPKAIARLSAPIRRRLRVVQQTREENLAEARQLYDQAGVQAVCEPFFDDMGTLYGEAHIVIARAGASTVSELAAVGRPAIFIPLAIAMDDHQSANAAEMKAAGAAEVIDEAHFTDETLYQCLEGWLMDSPALAKRAEAARLRGRPQAHEALADLIETAART
ncbi:undecaprenyldiphospho-muramoylpentapeptide beta-N-acetylglucosaminyltransferase [Woodsholea maritima]|uniref:undecaprenyldiphospho-muramoylpentapeptide beta-N-acetylglucosaminyltransferase n=1 Tax=Woodsholea maritima TaxID=240237 RepID=UPI00036F9F03|nr:undecaprenyldiphospho-muramoylpentapeptide beta-N-acetylglucosaminyltransferase [Woodsholea maritima]